MVQISWEASRIWQKTSLLHLDLTMALAIGRQLDFRYSLVALLFSQLIPPQPSQVVKSLSGSTRRQSQYFPFWILEDGVGEWFQNREYLKNTFYCIPVVRSKNCLLSQWNTPPAQKNSSTCTTHVRPAWNLQLYCWSTWDHTLGWLLFPFQTIPLNFPSCHLCCAST